MSRDLPVLEATAAYVTWKFHGKGLTDPLLQVGASLFLPPDCVAFVARLWALRDTPAAELPEVDLPGQGFGPGRPDPERLARAAAGDAPRTRIGRLAWLYWPELLDHKGEALLRSRVRAKFGTAWAWEVFEVGGDLEAAFTAFDHNSEPIPVYTLERRPLAELPAAFAAPGELTTLFQW